MCVRFCVFVCVLYYSMPHVKTPKWWELWRYFNVYGIVKNVIVDLWRYYNILCQTHEAFLWTLKVPIVYVGVVLIVDNVWIIKYVWLVKPLESILQVKFGTCLIPFCLCWYGYRICPESYVVCSNWKKLKKTIGVHGEWDQTDLTPRDM